MNYSPGTRTCARLDERKKAITITRFHVDTIDPSVLGEEAVQVRLASFVIEIAAENRPHRRKSLNLKKTPKSFEDLKTPVRNRTL